MKEPWIQTYSGKQFCYWQCRPEDICIRDIARALSNICRFTGHCKRFYSVAQHSVLVSEQAINPFLGLMHDAAEAYVGDMNRPLKSAMPNDSPYLRMDAIAWGAISERWGELKKATAEEKADCKQVDLRMLITESHDLLLNGPHKEWSINQETHPRYDFTISPWHPDEAMERFLYRFQQLTGQWPY